jgi:ornithine cyclodeaminase/alanine dehydrogenase-like protein (mu-crystallin family)
MKSPKDLLLLSMEDVLACGGADLELAAGNIKKGFSLLNEGKIHQPPKTTLRAPNIHSEHHQGIVNLLSSYIDEESGGIFGIKALGAMPSNVTHGLPRATGLILLFDPATKTPLCVMDAQVISATRTGAVSYLAVKKLVDPSVERIGLVGSGVNMRTQLLALRLALPNLCQVRVTSKSESRVRFAAEMSGRIGLDILPVDSVDEATENAQVIVTCLANSNQPAVLESHLDFQGLTILNIGCYECEDKILARMDRIVADIWEHGKHRGVQTHAIGVKNGVISERQIEDLGPILNGEKPGRTSKTENIFFCPTGLGFEDAMVASRVYREALRSNRGTRFHLWNHPVWI